MLCCYFNIRLNALLLLQTFLLFLDGFKLHTPKLLLYCYPLAFKSTRTACE